MYSTNYLSTTHHLLGKVDHMVASVGEDGRQSTLLSVPHLLQHVCHLQHSAARVRGHQHIASVTTRLLKLS